MGKTDLTRKQKAQAIFHLSIVGLLVAGLIFCAGRLLLGCGPETSRQKREKREEAVNTNNKDHREPVRHYSQLLNDLQDVQIVAAQKNGIGNDFTREDLTSGKFKVTHIETNKRYIVDELTHSSPYLVPKAADLLDDMGKAFQDSLFMRGYNRNHRFIVTSVTRTREDVESLTRRNVNATENSCHCYGTTFDISYTRFDKPANHAVTNDDKLYQVLMQVAYDYQQAERCYVKWEHRQKCLHITVRK